MQKPYEFTRALRARHLSRTFAACAIHSLPAAQQFIHDRVAGAPGAGVTFLRGVE